MNSQLLSSLRQRFSCKLWGTVGLAALVNWLCYEQSLGWTLGLLTFLLLMAMVIFQAPTIQQTHKVRGLAVLLTAGLGLAMVNHPFWLPAVLTILGLATISTLTFEQSTHNAIVWLKTNALWLGAGWGKPYRDLLLFQRLQRQNRLQWAFNRVWFIPIMLAVVFIVLFALANPIIGDWFNQFDGQKLMELLSPMRVLFYGATLWIIGALLKPFRFKQKSHVAETQPGPLGGVFSPILVRNSLILFNLLFLVQTGLDIAYLWGGLSLPAGMTYADYAHRGAYPLILTALLAGGFVLFALRPGRATERFPGIKWLVTAWIAQNVFLTVSSIFRTLLYVESYSLTHMRVAALIWMGLVALGLLWMILRIWRQYSNLWLINANILSLLVVLYTCSFVDFDNMIAWYSVQHNLETTGQGQTLDLAYFKDELGFAAIPALDWYERHAQLSPTAQQNVADIKHQLLTDLKIKLADWHAWTWQDQRLQDESMRLVRNTAQPLQPSGWIPECNHE